MIFLDTNLFLRVFVEPASASELHSRQAVLNLFVRIEAGELAATTSEFVVHEVAYVLRSDKQYGLSTLATITVIETIVGNPALQVPKSDREVWLRALELWKQNLKLGFADCVIAARCNINNWELATLDNRLARITERTRPLT